MLMFMRDARRVNSHQHQHRDHDFTIVIRKTNSKQEFNQRADGLALSWALVIRGRRATLLAHVRVRRLGVEVVELQRVLAEQLHRHMTIKRQQ